MKQHKYSFENIAYKSIKIDAIIRDSIKNLGKLLFSSGKKVLGYIIPTSITFVKNTLKDIKPKAEDIVVDKSTKFIHDVFNKPKKTQAI